jgi:hypothetical protein
MDMEDSRVTGANDVFMFQDHQLSLKRLNSMDWLFDFTEH